MRLVFILLFAFVLLWLACCKKDEPIDPSISPICLDFEVGSDECPWGGPLYKDGSPNYQKACFNPNNPDEFVYRHGNAVWKYTISSQRSEIVKDGIRPFTQLDWGRDGWITFTGSDWNVWILKDDGSEIRQLTSSTLREWAPEFNHEGKKILYQSWHNRIIDLNGFLQDSICKIFDDTICSSWEICAWSSGGDIVAEYRPNSSDYGLSLYDLKGNATDILYRSDNPDKNDDFIQDVEWHPDNSRVYFTDGFGLKVVNVTTKVVSTIKESCDSKTYFDISISSDGRTILASRKISTYSDCTVTSRMDLVLMDIDGCNEVVIELK